MNDKGTGHKVEILLAFLAVVIALFAWRYPVFQEGGTEKPEEPQVSRYRDMVIGTWFSEAPLTHPDSARPSLIRHLRMRTEFHSNNDLGGIAEMLDTEPNTNSSMTCNYMASGKWSINDRRLTMTVTDMGEGQLSSATLNGVLLPAADAVARGFACASVSGLPSRFTATEEESSP